jgi:3-methyladenine DNA glycosylase/8-oxoguanine DNA glycosylase
VSPFHLHSTFAMQVLGRFDPTAREKPGVASKMHHDSTGAVVEWRFTETLDGLRIEKQGGTADLFDAFVAQIPPDDGALDFNPQDPLLQRLAALRGLRFLRMPWPFDVACAVILQQRVRWQTGYGDFAKVARRFGIKSAGGSAFPTPHVLAATSVTHIEALGIDGKRARALIGLAKAEVWRPFLQPDADRADVRRRLLMIDGIGPWTTEMVMGYAYADCDAVPTGDLHFPSMVSSALAGEAEADGDRMLELLQPYQGQRFRVIRLLLWAHRRAPQLLVEHRALSRPAR